MKALLRRTLLRGGIAALILLAGWGPGLAAALRQDEGPRVAAQLSAGVVRLGDQVQLLIVAENAEAARVVAVPEVEGLELRGPGAPSSETQMYSLNGRMRSWRRLRWSVGIRATAPGEYEIPPIEMEVDGERVRTRPLTLTVVRDLSGADLGFLSVRAVPERVVEGQPFTLVLDFGWDANGRFNFANLILPWWGELPGAIELEDPGIAPGATKVEGVTVNDQRQVVVEDLGATPDRPGFRHLRLRKNFLPSRAGQLEISTGFLEFGRLSDRRTIFSSGRDKEKSYFVDSPSFSIDVVPLPTEGQPLDYTGAVGSIFATASVDARDVLVGDSLKLTVDWKGEGNLEFFEVPDLSRIDAFSGFRVYGKTEEKAFDRRRVIYDLTPLSDQVDRIPAVPLQVFDPDDGAYGTVRSEVIPIRVRPVEGAVRLESNAEGPRPSRDIRDIDSAPIGSGSGGTTSVLGDRSLATLWVALGVGWFVLRGVVRRGRGDPAAPMERRRRKARRRLDRDLSRSSDPKEELDAFTSFLAARRRERKEAWVGRTLSPETTTESPEELRAATELLARLEGAVYGTEEVAVERTEILEVADRLVKGGF